VSPIITAAQCLLRRLGQQKRPSIMIAIVAAVAISALLYIYGNPGSTDAPDVVPLYEDFEESAYTLEPDHISPNGLWYGKWHGAGEFGVRPDPHFPTNKIFYQVTLPVESKDTTHSALLLSTREYSDFRLSLDVRTDKQLRLNDKPNPWEVAWVIWRWSDNTHFYYFLAKTDGAEMGKYDGGSNPADQIILRTSSLSKTSIGQWMHWDIVAQGDRLVVIVNGQIVFDIEDHSSFDRGQIGLYSEDAAVSFDNIMVTKLQK
jgi:hypothetical protein